jgi:orotate phosphoribosyltransferase
VSVIKKTDVLGLLQEHGAVVSGHFQLSSGLHTPVYIQTAMVLQYPHVAQKIAKALVSKFPSGVEVIIAPGTSSAILGQEMARLYKCRSIFVESVDGMVALRRNFRLERGERALIVSDVVTSGRLSGEIVSLAHAYGAKVVGVGAIVDRSMKGLSLNVPIRTLIGYPLQVYPPDACPQCAMGVPTTDASRKATGAQEGE